MLDKPIRSGPHGTGPDLAGLGDGDVPFTTDFRQVYATILDDWLRADSKAILGGTFAHVPFL